MNFSTYRIVEKIGDLKILELTQIELSLEKILAGSLVDIASYNQFIEQFIETKVLDCQPPELNPLLPTEFSYRSSDLGNSQRKINGLVIGSEVDSLLEFVGNRLLSVPRNNIFYQNLLESSGISSDKTRLKYRLVSSLNADFKNRSEPYPAFPLICWPSFNENQRYSQNDHLEMIEYRIGEEDCLFFPLYSIYYFSPVRVWFDRLRYESDKQNSFSRGKQIFRPYCPFYYAPRELPVKNSNFTIKTVDYLVGLSFRGRYVEKYIWRRGDDQGVTEDPQNLPLGLLNNLEQNGRQLDRPELFYGNLPVKFLCPYKIVEAEVEQLEQLVKKPLKKVDVCPTSDWPDLLSKRFYLHDTRDLFVFSFVKPELLGSWKRSQPDSKPQVDFKADSRLAAYLLQKVKNGLYDPAHSSRPVVVDKLPSIKQIQLAISRPNF